MMKTLKDYEILIRELVKDASESNSEYLWNIKSFSKNRVKISLKDRNSGVKRFFTLQKEDIPGADFYLSSRSPDGMLMMSGHILSENPTHTWEESFEDGIKSAITKLIEYMSNIKYIEE